GDEEVVHETESLVEKPAPYDDRDDGRDHVGKEHEGTHHRPAAKGAVDQERRDQTEAKLERRRAGSVDGPLPEAVPELRIPDQARVVAEADPALGREERMLVEEGEPDRVTDGIEDEDADQEERGQDAEQPEARRGQTAARPRQDPWGVRCGRVGKAW